MRQFWFSRGGEDMKQYFPQSQNKTQSRLRSNSFAKNDQNILVFYEKKEKKSGLQIRPQVFILQAVPKFTRC